MWLHCVVPVSIIPEKYVSLLKLYDKDSNKNLPHVDTWAGYTHYGTVEIDCTHSNIAWMCIYFKVKYLLLNVIYTALLQRSIKYNVTVQDSSDSPGQELTPQQAATPIFSHSSTSARPPQYVQDSSDSPGQELTLNKPHPSSATPPLQQDCPRKHLRKRN